MRTRATGYLQRAVALATHSWFALGGALSKNPGYEGPVDSVQYGCWWKTTFEETGFFDETLIRNQDDEFNLRIRRNGGVVWQNPRIRSWIQPRSRLSNLYRQYWQYGYWKVRVIQLHRRVASLRHVVPSLMVVSLSFLALTAPLARPALLGLGLLSGAYCALVASATVAACWRNAAWHLAPALICVFPTIHFGYGVGFLRGVLDNLTGRYARSQSTATLSR